MLRVLSGSLMIALLAPALRADEPSKAAEELKKIQDELKEAGATFQKELREAKTAEERQEALKKNPSPKFFTRFYEFAEKNSKDPAAVQALNQCLRTAGASPTGASANFLKTLNLLEKEHLKSEELAKTVRLLASSSDENVIKFLKTVHEKSPSKNVQARTCQALNTLYEQMTKMGEQLKNETIREQYEKRVGKERVQSILALAEEGKKESEKYSKLLKEKYSDIIPDLSVGKKAPEVVSKDLNGKEVKLSDLKGKVVVLDIWATWCGPCVAMIPHEREMVKKMEGKPFTLVSISADAEKDTLTAFLKKTEMPWTHWWNGASGGILEDWNVRFFPTIYVLDAKGVIRHIGLRGEKLEEAVNELVKEAEAK